MYQELAQDNLKSLVDSGEAIVVQYSAGWCGNCRMMKPKFKNLASTHEDMKFVMVDAENMPESRKLAEVTNLPTFATFKNGKLIGQVQTNKAVNLENLIHEAASH